ncbi:MAG: aldehyde dehydrogenase family protein [Deltaproteobacteria bacterium]|nr:aldehyde dehydrogenase family protein [Deltaproteobacteria bacterium]
MIIGGRKIESKDRVVVRSPYDNSIVGEVSRALETDVRRAVESAGAGRTILSGQTAYERYSTLMRLAGILSERSERFAKTISSEMGKTIKEARAETSRAVETVTWSAEEAKRLYGSTVPMDAAPTGKGKIGFYLRVPVGVVAAISPFNFPLNLSLHKIAPAYAAGNAFVLKPAEATSLTGEMLGEAFVDAGAVPQAVNVLTGSGSKIGTGLVTHPGVRLITFTGSRDVGEWIVRNAGLKKVVMELGSNSAVVVCEDARPEDIVRRIALGGYSQAGQVCISVQRVYVYEGIFDRFVDLLSRQAQSLKTGNPLDESTDVGPLITGGDVERVKSWIGEAVGNGAGLVCGGTVDGNVMAPAVLVNAKETDRVVKDELFAPVIVVNRFRDDAEAIRMVNDSRYGLQTGVYTSDVGRAWKYAKGLDAGGILINEIPNFRVDLMPYGGVKESGIGREGPRFAMEEMTEIKLIAFHLD